MIKTILFDIGGVITETEFGSVYADFGSRIGLTKEIVEKYHKENFHEMLIGNLTIDDFWEDMKKAGGRDDVSYEDIWLEEITESRKINHELLGVISSLRKNYKIGVLSNLTPGRLIADEKINLYSHFDFTVLSCVEHLRKPFPLFYEIALERAGSEPEETLLIDDAQINLDTANQLGMKTILYKYANNQDLIDSCKNIGIAI
jgi:epoxide hydrolase-like predicted phosphatase